MTKRRSLIFPAVQNYPLKVPDLRQADLQALIVVLAIEPPRPAPPLYGENAKQQIQKAIRKLPSALRKKSLIFSPSASVPVATLCTTHKRLNQYIISHIFRLIQREAEDHLYIITKRYSGYPESLQSNVLKIVCNLQSLRGLWWDLQSSRNPPIDPIPFQQNKCEACMISRVIASLEVLRDLRTALLSRTRERCSYRPPPKLSCFVDGALHHRHGISLQSFIQSVTKLSSDLKRARKDAARCIPRQHSRRCDGTKCEPCLPSRIVPDSQLICRPPEETSRSSPTNLNANFDPKRRPDSQAIKFCLVPETISPFELAKKLQEVQEDDEQRKIQDLLIQEILSAYGPFGSSLEVAAPLNLNSRYLSYISKTPRYGSDSTNYNPRESLLSDLSDWEDNWDERSTAINPGSLVVDRLIDRIGSLLAENEGRDEPESGRSLRTIGIVSPPMPYEATVSDYLERRAERNGWYDSDESGAETVTDPRKSSETTTWSMMKSQQKRGNPHNSYQR